MIALSSLCIIGWSSSHATSEQRHMGIYHIKAGTLHGYHKQEICYCVKSFTFYVLRVLNHHISVLAVYRFSTYLRPDLVCYLEFLVYLTSVYTFI